ncbi:hypothetical protein AMECASPLE_024233 [Ameca splendens]|uniref:Uncharacterized protein n=1 Tax=Ameca splendens TaxID=208324 RepID=A0ABV0ZF54_9TELE
MYMVVCVSVLPCDGLVTCPGCTPPLTRGTLETGTSSSPPTTLYRRTRCGAVQIKSQPHLVAGVESSVIGGAEYLTVHQEECWSPRKSEHKQGDFHQESHAAKQTAMEQPGFPQLQQANQQSVDEVIKTKTWTFNTI